MNYTLTLFFVNRFPGTTTPPPSLTECDRGLSPLSYNSMYCSLYSRLESLRKPFSVSLSSLRLLRRGGQTSWLDSNQLTLPDRIIYSKSITQLMDTCPPTTIDPTMNPAASARA